MSRTPPEAGWKRQAALFGALVSALTGLGILLVIWFTRTSPAEKTHSPALPGEQQRR